MVKPIKTQLFASKAPLEWATVGNGILFTEPSRDHRVRVCQRRNAD